MLARTHGQPATPTTLGKEIANFVYRLERQREQFATSRSRQDQRRGRQLQRARDRVSRNGLAGVADASSNRSACTNALHDADRAARLDRRVLRRDRALQHDPDRPVPRHLGLHPLGYFRRALAGEVGSSTMPHKVNPIDFENAEGNSGSPTRCSRSSPRKLPISRWQRDLTDSTVLRNLGVAFGHTLVALEACSRGLSKLDADPALIAADLEQRWEVLAEAVQTVMRRYGLAEAYEQLKALTRGRAIDRDTLREFIAELDIPSDARNRLLELTPSSYMGLAAELARTSEPRRAAPATLLPCDTSRRLAGPAIKALSTESSAWQRTGPGLVPISHRKVLSAVGKP